MKSEKLKTENETSRNIGAVYLPGEELIFEKRLKNFSLFTFHFSLFLLFAFSTTASAQEETFQETAPPPLKIVSKTEKSSLEAETKVGERTKLTLELMENRLKRAEDFSTRNQYAEMSDELGVFHALMDNALGYLNKNDAGRGKVLNNFKRFELSLRQFIPRIELIRRELPARYEFYVRSLIKNARAARSKAVEPFFSDSVISGDKGN